MGVITDVVLPTRSKSSVLVPMTKDARRIYIARNVHPTEGAQATYHLRLRNGGVGFLHNLLSSRCSLRRVEDTFTEAPVKRLVSFRHHV